MKDKKILILFLHLLLCFEVSKAAKPDSLLSALKSAQHDSVRFNCYIKLGSMYSNTPDSAIYFFSKAQNIAQKMEDELKECDAVRRLGIAFSAKGDENKPLILFEEALRLAVKHLASKNKSEGMKAKNLKSIIYENIGAHYISMDDFNTALHNHLISAELSAEIGNKKNLLHLMLKIGNDYFFIDNFPKAIEYYFKGLKLAEEAGDKQKLADCYGRIGTVFSNQGYLSKALEYYLPALKLSEEIDSKYNILSNLGNIGIVYTELKNYDKALSYYSRALSISKEIGNKFGESMSLGNLGIVYKEKGDYYRAIEFYNQAIIISEAEGNKKGLCSHYANRENH